jgi:hypothetical protein
MEKAPRQIRKSNRSQCCWEAPIGELFGIDHPFLALFGSKWYQTSWKILGTNLRLILLPRRFIISTLLVMHMGFVEPSYSSMKEIIS